MKMRRTSLLAAAAAICACIGTGAAVGKPSSSLDRTFAGDGIRRVPAAPRKATELACTPGEQGSLYALMSSYYKDGTAILSKIDRRGRRAKRFGRSGVVKRLATRNPKSLAFVAGNKVMLFEDRLAGRKPIRYRRLVSRLTSSGRVDRRYGRRGVADLGVDEKDVKNPSTFPELIALPSGAVAVLQSHASTASRIKLIDARGRPNRRFAGGEWLTFDFRVQGLTELRDGRLAVVGIVPEDPAAKFIRFNLRVLMLQRSGQIDSTWAPDGRFDVTALPDWIMKASSGFRTEQLTASSFSHAPADIAQTRGGAITIAAKSYVGDPGDSEVYGWTVRLRASGGVDSVYGRDGFGYLGSLYEAWEGTYSGESYEPTVLPGGAVYTSRTEFDGDDANFSGESLSANGKSIEAGPRTYYIEKFLTSVHHISRDGRRAYICGYRGKFETVIALKTGVR